MNYRIETVEVKLSAGTSIGSNSIALPLGKLLGIVANVQSEGQNTLFLNTGITDDAGASVNKVSDIRFWKQRNGGSFHQSYVPLNIDTKNLTHIFQVSTTKGSALPVNDCYVQYILIYAHAGKELECISKQ